MSNIRDNELPETIDELDVAGLAYPAELADIVDSLRRRLSVLVEVDKDMVVALFAAVRRRLQQCSLRCVLVDGRPPAPLPGSVEPPPPDMGFVTNMLQQMRAEIRNAALESPVVLVMPHLDVLATSQGGALASEAKEAIPLMYESPYAVVLAFRDPSLALPPALAARFPQHIRLSGIPRDRVQTLITQRDMRKFQRGFGVAALYKHISGLNPAKLRRIMSALDGEDHPADNQRVLRQLRRATTVCGMELPTTDLHNDIGGYARVKQQLSEEVLQLLAARDAAAGTPRAKEIEALIPRGMIFWGPPGTGKCLGRGTPVLRFDGTVVPVEAVRTGDLLMGPDSKPRRVLSTNTGCGPLYRIHPVKGDSWVCNDVHVMTLVNTDTDGVIDIPLDKYLKLPPAKRERLKLFSVGADFPGAEPLPLDPYFLGVWFGDGSKTMLDNGLYSVSITKPDPEIKQLCEKVAADFGLQCIRRDSNDARCPTWCITSGKRGWTAIAQKNPLLDLLRDLVGKQSKIPQQYLTASRSDRAEFLAGFIDTDGHVSRGGVEIVQKRRDWADAVAFVARSLGFRVTERDKKITPEGSDTAHMYRRLFISGDLSSLPMRIHRKKPKPRTQIKDVLRTGFTVEAIGDGEYFGFTLAGDGRFLLGDFTVTHNTMFAKAMAKSLGAAITIVSGPELKSKWVGESEERLRTVFADARRSAPSIIVFDELDSFATARGTYTGSGVEHSMVNQLLTEMDGFRKEELVFVVGTTNFVESLDAALLRPGRFEYHLEIPYPDAEDRKAILQVYNRSMSLGMDDEVLDYTVRRTDGTPPGASANTRYAGDHLNALCRALARIRLRESKTGPTTEADVDNAITRWVELPKLTAYERTVVATHEAGHAICALHTPHAPKIERISISGDIGGALGYVKHAQSRNKYIMTRGQLWARLVVLFGGAAAERQELSDECTGCSHDYYMARTIAAAMVQEFGWAGKEGKAPLWCSDASLHEGAGAAEVNSLLQQASDEAERLLREHRPELHVLRDQLLADSSVEMAKIQTPPKRQTKPRATTASRNS